MAPVLTTTEYATVVAVVVGTFCWITFTRPSKKLFPGPRGLPLIGNLGQIPMVQRWRHFEKLSKIHGPTFRLSLAGNEVLVLNDPKDAEELLGRRSHNYSSRPPLVYLGKYQSRNKRLVILPYGNDLKRQRAAFSQMVQPRTVGGYEEIQEVEATKLLHASLVFHLAYGGRLKDDSRDLEAVTQILVNFVQDASPGKHIVDSFPWLDDILPDFLAPWRAEATAKHHYEMNASLSRFVLYKRLALEVKSQMDSDQIGVECFAARLWDGARGKTDVDLEELAYIPGSAFEAGTDTSTGVMQWFVMAMLLYPQTMRKAQVELDSVLGGDGQTMPGFLHFPRLPYCCALVKEVMRWAPPAPAAFPHTSEHDDEYQGYLIPAKTMVVPCIWSMHHLEELYPDSMSFKPERFLDSGKTEVDPNDLLTGHYSFGFGRRKCPGMYLGARSVWIGIVRMLWAFHIDYKLDDEGKRIPVSPENCTSGVTSRPEDFPFTVRPRSEDHKLTVLKQFAITK